VLEVWRKRRVAATRVDHRNHASGIVGDFFAMEGAGVGATARMTDIHSGAPPVIHRLCG
jgi:hypothetical protein